MDAMFVAVSPVLIAFAFTLVAGLSTGIGGVIAFVSKRTSGKHISLALGFSAGVMLYVSFVEMLPDAVSELGVEFGEVRGAWFAALAFFGGMLLIGVIDRLVPSFENPHELRGVEEMRPGMCAQDKGLMRLGVVTALAIAIHNFPEGMATFMATINDPTLGFSIALAIAIHNIPEGLSVAVPVFCATGSKSKALLYSFGSGLAEPLGALAGYLLLSAFLSPAWMGLIFAAVAGIMVFISLDELLPSAEKYGAHHHAIYGLLGGMAVMAFSLLVMM